MLKVLDRGNLEIQTKINKKDKKTLTSLIINTTLHLIKDKNIFLYI